MLVDTRSGAKVGASEAVIKGIGDSGGLIAFVGAEKFRFDEEFINLGYNEIAERVLGFVLDDFSAADIKEVVDKAYSTENFACGPAVFKSVGEDNFLELWHGPTCAFKDVALTMLGGLIKKAKKNVGFKDKTIILTATSGDTGSATLSGLGKTVDSTVVLYPDGGVSGVQEAQMHAFSGGNAHAVAVKGNFDFCQTLAKKIFSSPYVKIRGAKLSSANSINIGRLAPQIVYYFFAYKEMVRSGKIKFGDKVNFAVPTGNFGNILACLTAKAMNLPVGKAICASNANRVLTDFFNGGVYNRNRKFLKTISPSMDILVSSNLERLLFTASGGDEKLVNRLMRELNENGEYRAPESVMAGAADVSAFSLDDEETKKVIGEEYFDRGYLVDPHTAVALGALWKYRAETGDKTPAVVASTADPYKFPTAVSEALGAPKKENSFEAIETLETFTRIPATERLKKLKDFVYKKTVWEKETAEAELRRLLGDENAPR